MHKPENCILLYDESLRCEELHNRAPVRYFSSLAAINPEWPHTKLVYRVHLPPLLTLVSFLFVPFCIPLNRAEVVEFSIHVDNHPLALERPLRGPSHCSPSNPFSLHHLTPFSYFIPRCWPVSITQVSALRRVRTYTTKQ